MKRWKAGLLAAVALSCVVGVSGYVYMQGLGDVRTHYAKTKGASADAQKKGRALLARSIAKIGGAQRWKQLRELPVKITFEHDWHDRFLRTFFMPLEFSGQRLSLLLRPKSPDARLTFLDGERSGTAWGRFQEKTYEVRPDGAVIWQENETIEFQVPSYRYFFFLPFYVSEAELITYAGAQKLHGKTYDLVYASWGKWTPQETVDQYLVWINRENSMIDFVQSTVRSKFARSIVTLSLADYREVLGVQLPFSLKLLEDINVVDAGMHHVRALAAESATEDAALLSPRE